MRIWHRFLGIFLLGEAAWFVYAVGFKVAFGDLETSFLVLTAGIIGIILAAKG